MGFMSGMDVTLYPVVPASCVTFLLSYKYASPFISSKMCPGYKKLPRAKQIEWDTRTVSSMHALLVSLTGLYIVFYEDSVHRDPVWGESKLVRINCAIVIGYMLSDMIVVIRHYKEIGEVFYLFHHGASIYAYYFVLSFGVLPWFANFRLLAELSTPSVNLRWFLDALGHQKSSPLFMINGVVMAVVFFLVRIAVMPTYWLKVYSIYNTPPCIALGRIWYVLLSSCAVLDIINLYWFMKIFKGAKKVIEKSKLLSLHEERKNA